MGQNKKPSLMVHEWLAIATLIGMLGMLTILSVKGNQPTLSQTTENFQTAATLSVAVTGAVEKPGSYQLPKDALIHDLIIQAKPLPNANLKKINPNKMLKNGQTIHIPQIEEITIYLEGAVKRQGPYQVPKGTRLSDLPMFIEYEPDANLKSLNKKRRLKDNELIRIESQSSFKTPSNNLVNHLNKKNNET